MLATLQPTEGERKRILWR